MVTHRNSQPLEGLATTEDGEEGLATTVPRTTGHRSRGLGGQSQRGGWRWQVEGEAAGEGGRRGHQGLRGWVGNWLGLSWKNGISRISENETSRSNTGNTKTIGTQAKLFPSHFRIWHPVFCIDSEFVQKYGKRAVKCRNWDGTEHDLSRPFSTLVVRPCLVRDFFWFLVL